MKNVLLTISYDGTAFAGWQRQQGVRTVQEEIEKALATVHKAETSLHGSGRTDSGVHAAGQAANFISPYDRMPADKYVPALNTLLPRDVRVLSSEQVPEDFHARFSAVSRTYRYFIYCGSSPLAHRLPYIWAIRHYPDIVSLNRMASALRGELDCTSFSSAQDQSKSRCRYIENAVFYPEGDMLVFEITANAFLWKMVRSLTGTLLYFERKGYDWNYFEQVLQRRDRSLAGPTAPPQGLFLWSVSYTGKRRGPPVVQNVTQAEI